MPANAESTEPGIEFLLKQKALTPQAWFCVRYCLVRMRMLVAWHDASIFLILTHIRFSLAAFFVPLDGPNEDVQLLRRLIAAE